MNTILVKYFGCLTEVTQNREETFSNAKDMNDLISLIKNKYPDINNYSFSTAIDQTITNENKVLSGNHTIALMPPFAGG